MICTPVLSCSGEGDGNITGCWKFEASLGNTARPAHAFSLTDTGQEKSQLPGPSVRSSKQMIAALEDRRCVLLIPHIDTQGQVQGRGDDTVRILEMKSSEAGLWLPRSRKHASGRKGHTHHPHRRNGPLVVVEGHQLQAVDGEQHQLRSGGQQDHLGAMALHEVRSHSVRQGEAGQLLCLEE